jgi:hypothetical protein
MVSFVKPNLLGTSKEFSNSFIRPIENGQCADSTVMDVKLMKRRCHVLHKTLEGCVQVGTAFINIWDNAFISRQGYIEDFNRSY